MCNFIVDETDLPNICKGDTKFQIMLKYLMWCKRLDEKQLAEILQIRQSQIPNLVNGKSKPSYCTLQQFKNKFDWDINHFFE